MSRIKQILWQWIAIGCLALAAQTQAQDTAEVASAGTSAHDVVNATTQAVMKSVAGARNSGGEPTAGYYAELEAILDPVIDFRGFARGVMGPYATSERYRSLDAAGRQQLVGQLNRFTDKMRDNMVHTYGKGLLAFGGSRIELTRPGDEDGDGKASVQQLIYNEGTVPYTVYYQMGRNKDGEWKLRNMIIENVNLGEVYRSQFESAARQYDGDLDKVIDNWAGADIRR